MSIINQKFFNDVYKDVIGGRELVNRLNGFYSTHNSSTTFPPYNIIELAESKGYVIELAVAGFSKQEITLSVEDNSLSVIGEKKDGTRLAGDTMIHCGIAARNFERRFLLQENVFVKGAEYNDGILSIKLERIEPKKEKMKLIQIS